MNMMMLSLLYPNDQIKEAKANAKDKLQNQINAVQHALIDGIRNHLQNDETFTVLNSLPVGIYPVCYRKPWLSSGWHDQHSVYNLASFNLPYLKQKQREKAVYRAIVRWRKHNKNNRTLLVYTMYLPYLKAIIHAKKRFPDLKAVIIVTDLPNEFGLPSGRVGLLKKIEHKQGLSALQYARQMDGFILMSRHMAEPLQLSENQPRMVLEGIIQNFNDEMVFAQEKKTCPVALYTGTLEPELGILDMLQAFKDIPDAELWICGNGSLENEVAKTSREEKNIRFFGKVPREKALSLQRQCDMLINPRKPDHLFTRYSFPSKTLEYLLAAKPVVCYPLEGIPEEYSEYLCYVQGNDLSDLICVIRHILFDMTEEERAQIGQKGKTFILQKKSHIVQCQKLMMFLRNMQ